MAEQFSGRARAARLALIDGVVGVVWAPGGLPRVAIRFTITERGASEVCPVDEIDVSALPMPAEGPHVDPARVRSPRSKCWPTRSCSEALVLDA